MKRRLISSAITMLIIALALTICAFTGAQGKAGADGKLSFTAMDTVMSLNVPDADEELLQKCADRVYELEKKLSVTDESSEIALLNANGEGAVSEDTQDILAFALGMCADTGGALDISLYPIVRAWGFTTGQYRVPEQSEIDELLQKVDYRNISVNEGNAHIGKGCMVDLGSVAKGYAADELHGILSDAGISTGLIDLGGNLYCMGTKADGSKWKVGLKDPLGDGYCGALEIIDSAVATSGCYERYFEGEDGAIYGHIFDPSTGYPVDNGVLSVTVTGKSAAVCDALSTALFVMGSEKACEYLKGHEELDAVIICRDEQIYATSRLKDAFSPIGDYADWTVNWIE